MSYRDELTDIIQFGFVDTATSIANRVGGALMRTGSKIGKSNFMGGGQRKLGNYYQSRAAIATRRAEGAGLQHEANLNKATTDKLPYTPQDNAKFIKEQDSAFDAMRIHSSNANRLTNKARGFAKEANMTAARNVGGVAALGIGIPYMFKGRREE